MKDRTEWITKEQVKEAAKDKKTALQMSYDHHLQGATCTRGELIDAIDKDLFSLDADLCACCEKWAETVFVCGDCPLVQSKNPKKCCGGVFTSAIEALKTFTKDSTPANFAAFQAAEQAVCAYIQAVIDKEAEPEEVFSVGDRFKRDDTNSTKYILIWPGAKHPYEVTLSSLLDGNCFSSGHRVSDRNKITQTEMDAILSPVNFKRYWSAAQNKYTDGRDEPSKVEDKKCDKVEDKPKLKVGDRLFDTEKNKPLLVIEAQETDRYKLTTIGADGIHCGYINDDGEHVCRTVIRIDNCLDDLTKTSDGFEMKTWANLMMEVSIGGDGDIYFHYGPHNNCAVLKPDNLDEFMSGLMHMRNGIRGKK